MTGAFATARQWLVVLILLGLMLAAADLFVSTLSIVLLTFAGILFGIFLNGLSTAVARHLRLSYRWSYLVVIVLLIAVTALGFTYMGSKMVLKVSELSDALSGAAERLVDGLEQSQWFHTLVPDASEFRTMLGGGRSGFLPELMKGLTTLVWTMTGLAVIFFVGLYVAFDPELYQNGLVKLVPPARRTQARELLAKLRTALGRWILGRIISMTIIGLLTALGLWLLGVSLPMTLGVLAALLTFIPNIGPFLAAFPQALLALEVGTMTVLYVLLFNVALQMAESYLITPIIQRYEVTLPPAVTIFAQLLMAVVVGVIGIIMAAPLMVVIMVAVQMLYIHRQLGDPHPGRLIERS